MTNPTMRTSRLLVPALLGLAFAACGDLGTILNTPITLSATEVGTLFQEIGALFDQANITLSRSATTPGTVVLSLVPRLTPDRQASISATVNCPGGGTVAFTGTTSSDASSVDASSSFKACKTANYTIDGTFTDVQTVTSNGFTQTLGGDLTLTTAGKEGSCHVDVQITATGTGSSFTATATGTMCGVQASTISAIS
jgi:hypothetical protein